MRSRRLRLRKERVDLLRSMLLSSLGGCCASCGRKRGLEVNHVDGCTWPHRRVSREVRVRRYVEEYRAGVRLNVLCRSCNGAGNQHRFGTRRQRGFDDVVEEIEAEERAA